MTANGYMSQCQQDAFVDKYLSAAHRRTFCGGTFVEVGAADGVTHSNTLFLEQVRGWRGVLIEPHPHEFAKLVGARTSRCLNCAISDFNGQASFTALSGYLTQLSSLTDEFDSYNMSRIEQFRREHETHVEICPVPVRTLQSVLDAEAITHIDYLSVDTEGNEMKVLRGIDFKRTSITVITLENNVESSAPRELLNTVGMVQGGRLGWDDVFVQAIL